VRPFAFAKPNAFIRHDDPVPVKPLDAATEAKLRACPFTYGEVGQSARDLPSGYTTFSKTATLVKTRGFDIATAALLSWQVQQRAGIHLAASSALVETDAVVLLRFGFGPFGVRAPCRVVYVIDEPLRRGFAYGTLPGHPESGEESFVLTLGDDGRIGFTITAFSRPATALAKLGGPVNRAVQRAITSRYLTTFDR
jgi:uncharacterized protein (UPF0548 family)